MQNVDITFLGQSGFLLQTSTSSILIDPKDKKSGDVSGNIIYATHYHSDHIGGVDTFLKRNNDAEFICNEQVAKRFKKWKERILVIEPDEVLQKDSWTFTFI
ncbi:MAG: MBL fold metallo-hydrolase [Candidatus Hodarchaeales archaeon]|jgi:L-ascorbate metabolism protein UlaG (beta-lactamase superfamily)